MAEKKEDNERKARAYIMYTTHTHTRKTMTCMYHNRLGTRTLDTHNSAQTKKKKMPLRINNQARSKKEEVIFLIKKDGIAV